MKEDKISILITVILPALFLLVGFIIKSIEMLLFWIGVLLISIYAKLSVMKK